MTERYGRFPALSREFWIVDTPAGEEPQDVLEAFAWDEAVCRRVGEGSLPPVARLWRHPHALVLGLRDRRLPYAREAMERLRLDGVSVGVRNSGGAAVPLDLGVVNLSLILPYEPGEKMDFHNEFRMMAALIGDTAGEWTAGIGSGEIRGAYCPGEYDLAVGGRKFCGIAQRRQLKAYVVSAFIVVEGSGAKRGLTARQFYQEATGGQPHNDDPGIVPAAMASLQELAGVPSAEAFMSRMKRRLAAHGGAESPKGWKDWLGDGELAAAKEELKRRYDPDNG